MSEDGEGYTVMTMAKSGLPWKEGGGIFKFLNLEIRIS